MNSALTLKRGISAEIYKFRSTFLFWFIILAPAFVPLINLIVFLQRGTEILERDGTAWGNLMQYSTGPTNFLYPFFVFIVALYVNNVEWSSNTWKLIYTQSVSRLNVYFSKLIVFISMLLFSQMLYALLLFLVGKIVHASDSELGFGEPFDLVILFGRCFRTFLAVLGFASIQFLISQRTKNLILPLGVGIAGIISFMILVQGWEYVIYHPYGYHILAAGPFEGGRSILIEKMQPIYLSLGLSTVVIVLGAIDAIKKRIL